MGHGLFKGSASTLLQDVPTSRTMTRFSARDSVALERAYRLDRDAIDMMWWEEEGNLLEEQMLLARGGSAATSPVKAEGLGSAVAGAAAPLTAARVKQGSPPADTAGALAPEDSVGTSNRSMGRNTKGTPPVSPLAGPSGRSGAAERRQSQSWADFIGLPERGSLNHEIEKSEEIGTLVRGRRFEVDLRSRLMRPCYWPGRKHRVVRGTWFLDKQGDFLPLREVVAERLETAFVSRVWDPSKKMLTVQRDGRLAARVELGSFQGSVVTFALFYSGYDIYLVEDTSFAWLKKKLSKSGGENRYALRRGYVEPAADALQREADLEEEKANEEADMEPTPTALVLAVHGIGQNVSGANIIQDAAELKQAIRKAEEASLGAKKTSDKTQANLGSTKASTAAHTAPDAKGVGGPDDPKRANLPVPSKSRVEVLPVQWRKTLNLEIDGLASSLMPSGISSLRHVLHSTAVEVLFYLTPSHRRAILDSVVYSLNVVYNKFMARNPEFDGQISLFAHSLGSVLCWDVLCNQGGESVDPAGVGSRRASSTAQSPSLPPTGPPAWAPVSLDIGRLAFDVDNFIVAGSPLGCFLALRGVDQARGLGLGTPASAALMHTNPANPGSADGLPRCKRMYNIFHPLDPVVYKLEPLAYPPEALAGRKTALVELAGGGRRLHIAAEEFGDALVDNVSRFGSSIAGYFSSAAGNKLDRGDASTAGGNSGEAVDFMEEPRSDRTGGSRAGTKPEGPCEPGPGIATGAGGDSRQPIGSNASNISRIVGHLPDLLGRPTSADGRLDFSLQEAYVQHEYVQALSSHFSYWGSADVGKFCCRVISGLDPISGQPATGNRPK